MSAKSDNGLPARSGATRMDISEEERIFRWTYAMKEHPDMDIDAFAERIKEIRKRTGKP